MLITSGNEFSIGLVFFIWFIAGSLGSFIGKKISPKKLFLFFTLYPIVFLISITLLKLNRIIINPGQGQLINLWSMLWFSCVTLGMVAFFGDMCLVLGYRYFKSSNFIKVYYFDSLGHMCSGIIFTYILISFFSSEIIYSIILALFSISHILLSIFEKKKRYLLFSIIIFIFAIFASNAIDRLTEKNWKLFNKSFTLKDHTDTHYNNLALLSYGGINNLYVNGNLSLTFPEDITIQSEIWTAICQIPSSKETNIALIGGGGTDLVYYFSKSIPGIRITDIEIDKKEIEFIHKHYNRHSELSNQKNIEFIYKDGRSFLQNTKQKFDIISLHTGDPNTLLVNRYYTLEFFKTIKNTLNNDGIFTFSLSSSENYQGTFMNKLNKSIYKSLKQSFQNIIVSPGDTNTFYASNSSYLTEEAKTLSDRYRSMNLPPNPKFSHYQFQMTFPKWKKGKVIKKLQKDLDKTSENSDYKPTSIAYSLLNWFDMLNPDFRKFVSKIDSFYYMFFYFILPVIVILSLNNGTLKIFNKIDTFCQIFFISFSGIVFDLLAIFIYQLNFGTLYSDVGILTAAFMLGLIISIKVFTKSGNITIVYGLSTLTCGLLILCNLYPVFGSFKIILLIIIALSGVIIGSGFSVIIRKSPENYLSIYVGDLLGSAICSLGVLSFLLPSLGFMKLILVLTLYFIIAFIYSLFHKN
ncbi:hypothetical protein KAJ27_12775 [bacterium]|nr:hypothetical protein [bacterium]